MGLFTDRINNKLEKSDLINEHALNRKPFPFTLFISSSAQRELSNVTGFYSNRLSKTVSVLQVQC